jgi:hypothetical protein
MREIVASKDLDAAAELSAICREIVSRGLTDAEWSDQESCDAFQSEHLSGGYEASELAFCFSLYLPSGEERWISLSLYEAEQVAAGSSVELHLRVPS